jgi:hypothetical protein
MARRNTVFIVCSPRQRVGKTLVARILTEFVLAQGRAAMAFDLNPNNAALSGFLPRYAARADLSQTRGQMALFDELIAEDEVTKIVDLGDETFERFFTLARQIALVEEARRRMIDVVALFIADADPRTAATYAALLRDVPAMALVPVHNEQVASLQSYMEHFPSPSGEPALRIPVLSPYLKSIVDKPGFSFADYLERPHGTRTELHEWIDRAFMEFRQLELRLLLRDLKVALTLR